MSRLSVPDEAGDNLRVPAWLFTLCGRPRARNGSDKVMSAQGLGVQLLALCLSPTYFLLTRIPNLLPAMGLLLAFLTSGVSSLLVLYWIARVYNKRVD
jgi:hypothetical protein